MRTHRNITARQRGKTTPSRFLTLTVFDSGSGAGITLGDRLGTLTLDREAALQLALALQYAVATPDELVK